MSKTDLKQSAAEALANAAGAIPTYDADNAAKTGAQMADQMAVLLKGDLFCSLYELREVDANGDVGAITANGGLLASDTTPILRGDAAESQEVVWAASNSDKVAYTWSLPRDFSGEQDVTVRVRAASGGTTDACSFTCETGWDGGALVSDTITGAASTTEAAYTATIAAADVPDSPSRLTLILTPAAHTTDTMSLFSVRVEYHKAQS